MKLDGQSTELIYQYIHQGQAHGQQLGTELKRKVGTQSVISLTEGNLKWNNILYHYWPTSLQLTVLESCLGNKQ